MSKFQVLIVGKSRCRWANEAVADYTKRLRRYGGVNQVFVKGTVFRGDVDAVRADEGRRLLERAKGTLIALDERGKAMTTTDFAGLVDKRRQLGPVTFVVGGAYGLSEEVRTKADVVLRLSQMVLNHEVARVVLFEQLYRALNLVEGGPYHHA